MAQGVLAVPLWIPQLGYSGGLVILLSPFSTIRARAARAASRAMKSRSRQTAEEVVERAIQSGV